MLSFIFSCSLLRISWRSWCYFATSCFWHLWLLWKDNRVRAIASGAASLSTLFWAETLPSIRYLCYCEPITTSDVLHSLLETSKTQAFGCASIATIVASVSLHDLPQCGAQLFSLPPSPYSPSHPPNLPHRSVASATSPIAKIATMTGYGSRGPAIRPGTTTMAQIHLPHMKASP